MSRSLPASPFDGESPIGERIATGLAKLGLALRHRAWQGTGRGGPSPTQAQVLALLSARGELRPSDLARALAVTRASLSESLAALERKGLVRRRRDERDGRAARLIPTPAGRRRAREAAEWPDFLATAVEGLAEGEQRVLLVGLLKMIRTLQLRGEIPVSRMCATCCHFRPHVHASPDRPHHCALVDAPFGDRHLRLECGDHEPASDEDAARAWDRFLRGAPGGSSGTTAPGGGRKRAPRAPRE